MNLTWLRQAEWFHTWRAIGYARMFALAYIPSLIFIFFITTQGLVDFTCFWTTAKIALHSGGVAAYDLSAQADAQGSGDKFLPFMYPPPFLTVILPLGLLPYAWAYFAWTLSTYAAYLLTARRLLPAGLWPIAVYPAAFLNAALGQNAALLTALFCGAVITFRTRPFVSGLLLGGFIIKPQLALLFPIAMIAGRHWAVIAGAVVSSLTLILLSLLMFGYESWLAFIANSDFTRSVLEDTPGVRRLIISLFVTVRLAGGPVWLAYCFQAVLAIALAVIVFRAWRHSRDDGEKFSILAIGSVMATPYVLYYDLVLLIVPICWFAKKRLRHGFEPWTKATLAVIYLLPFIAFAAAYTLGANLAWSVILAFLIAILKWSKLELRSQSVQEMAAGATAMRSTSA